MFKENNIIISATILTLLIIWTNIFSHFIFSFRLIDLSAFPFQPKLSVATLFEDEHRTTPIKFLVKRASSTQGGLNDDNRRHPYTINLESAIVIDTRSMTREKDSFVEGESLSISR